jgi:hypothetical protein
MAKLLFIATIALFSSFVRSPQCSTPVLIPLSDTTKPYIVKGKRVTEREMDSLIDLGVKQTMDSLRARRYIVKQ